MKKRITGFLLALALCLTLSAGLAAQVRDCRTQAGEAVVAYPQLTGLPDETVQRRVNDSIAEKVQVTRHLVTLATLGAAPAGLTADYRVEYLSDNYLSVIFSAEGKLPGGREGHVYTALNYRLDTGEELLFSDLMTAPDAALSALGDAALPFLEDELSDYAENRDWLPLPENSFTFSADGLAFWYGENAVKLLSGRCGALHFFLPEFEEYLNTDGPAGEIFVKKESAEEARDAFLTAAADGRIPGLPVALGQPMGEITAAYRLVRTPDLFPGGRYFQMEDPLFREILLISDSMTSGWDRSVLEGIQMRRGSAAGLVIGTASREDWLALLGDPGETVTVTENMSLDYGLPQGSYDVYPAGNLILRFYADEEGVLQAVQLGK